MDNSEEVECILATYLLTWNPNEWHWEDLQECVAEIENHGYLKSRWSCGNTKKIVPGDRLFIVRLGSEPRGIFASGRAASYFYEDDHWDERKYAKARYVDMDLDVLLDPDMEDILSLETLEAISTGQTWTPQRSGISIEDTVATSLESEWRRFLNAIGKVKRQKRVVLLPDEVENPSLFHEGATHRVTVNAYERNPEARKLCIDHHGLSCCICSFNFEEVYGEAGKGFIHIHHLKPLSETGEEYVVDPVRDMRPVCPNCHAMIHKNKPAHTVEEVKEVLTVQSRLKSLRSARGIWRGRDDLSDPETLGSEFDERGKTEGR